MRHALATVAVALGGVSCVGLAASCANLGTQVEQLKPQSVRAAYAEAEIMFIGVLNATDVLAARGLLSNEQLASLTAAYVKIADTLDAAYLLIQAGDAFAAWIKLERLKEELKRQALALSMLHEAAASAPQPTPSYWQAPVI